MCLHIFIYLFLLNRLISLRVFREVLERPKRDTGMKLWFADGSLVDSRRLELPVQRPAPVKPGMLRLSGLYSIVSL